ncbi:MAG: sulfatase-like hydrolase/transferase [Planctomycetota bacterium]
MTPSPIPPQRLGRPPRPRPARGARRAVLPVLAVVAARAAGAASSGCGDEPAPEPRTVVRPVPTATPSVVLVDVAGLRLDLFEAQVREPATPADARPAPTRFRQALAPAGSSVPSLASTLTGWPASEVPGVEASSDVGGARLNSPAWTLAEMLRDEGYDTAAFVTASVVPAASGLDQGFEGAWTEAATPAAAADAAVAWLGARRGAKPFLLFVALDVGAFDAPTGADPVAGWVARSKAAEAQVTRLRNAAAPVLGATGLEIVFSDHGVGLGEDGRPAPARGGQVTDLRLRARLEIRGPGFPPVEVQGSCCLTDLLPTVRDAMGLPPERGLAGRSLLPLAAHPDHPGLPVVAQEWRTDRVGKEGVERRLYVVRTARVKYVATFTPRPVGWTEEVFDLGKDPGETTPLPATDLAPYGPEFTAAVTAVRDFLGGRRTHLNDEIVGPYLAR